VGTVVVMNVVVVDTVVTSDEVGRSVAVMDSARRTGRGPATGIVSDSKEHDNRTAIKPDFRRGEGHTRRR